MDKECDGTPIIPILPMCCFICNSSEFGTDVNQAVIKSTGSSLCELVQQLVPDGKEELQLLSTICPGCTTLVTEYDDLRHKKARIALYVREQYAASQAARAALDVVIELGHNRVTVPYGVYREHRVGAGQQRPPAADPQPCAQSPSAAATEPSPPPTVPSPPPKQPSAEVDLEIHVQGDRLCHVCDARFARFGELARHLREEHRLSSSEIRAVRTHAPAAPAGAAATRRVACPLCEDRVFASAERVRAHLLQRHRPQLEAGAGRSLPAELALHLCGQCGAAFRRADMCGKHEAAHRAQASAHRCELCGKTLRYRHGLKRHLLGQHGLAAGHPAVVRAAGPAARQPCDRCPQVFADYGKYLFHCRSAHMDEQDVGFGCEVCDRRFEKRSELRLHRESHQETSYSCVTCDKHFRTRLAYRKHVRVHSGGGWPCQHCDKVFDTRPNLVTHQQTHSTHRQHVCGECGAAFKFGQTLARHRAVRHAGDTPRYVCDVCGKAFAVEHSLNLHRSRHGPATLPCPRCGTKFANKPDLKRHVRRAHADGAVSAVSADPLQRALLAFTDDVDAATSEPSEVTFEVVL